MTLVQNEDFHEHGWADYTFPVFGIGAIPDEHATGGDPANIVEVELEEEFIRLTFRQGGEIELVHTTVPIDAGLTLARSGEAGEIPRSDPATVLDSVGGVAAILHFAP